MLILLPDSTNNMTFTSVLENSAENKLYQVSENLYKLNLNDDSQTCHQEWRDTYELVNTPLRINQYSIAECKSGVEYVDRVSAWFCNQCNCYDDKKTMRNNASCVFAVVISSYLLSQSNQVGLAINVINISHSHAKKAAIK